MRKKIIFNHLKKRSELNCLPEIAQKYEYRFYAFHSFHPGYYSRTTAYPKLGILEKNFFHSYNYFNHKQDGRRHRFLSDKEFFRQSWRKISSTLKTKEKSVFYLLTSGLHFPFTHNAPDRNANSFLRYKNDRDNEALDAFLKRLSQSAGAVKRFIQKIQRKDPTAKILLLGDHWPPLVTAYKSHDPGDYLRKRALPYWFFEKGESVDLPEKATFELTHTLYQSMGWQSPYPYLASLSQLKDGEFQRALHNGYYRKKGQQHYWRCPSGLKEDSQSGCEQESTIWAHLNTLYHYLTH